MYIGSTPECFANVMTLINVKVQDKQRKTGHFIQFFGIVYGISVY